MADLGLRIEKANALSQIRNPNSAIRNPEG